MPLLDEDALDAEYAASLRQNNSLLGVRRDQAVMPRGGSAEYSNPMTPGALASDTWNRFTGLVHSMSPENTVRGMTGAAGGVRIPEGAQIIEDDAGGRHFLFLDGTTQPIGEVDRRHGGLLDLAEALPMAGIGGGPAGTVGAGARRLGRGARTVEEAAEATPARRAGEARVPSMRAEDRAGVDLVRNLTEEPVSLASPRVQTTSQRERVVRDDRLLDYMDRQEAKPPKQARPIPPAEVDVFNQAAFDMRQVPDVPQRPLIRTDPNEGARRGVSERMQALVTNPDVLRQYRDLVRHGRDNLQGMEWYNMDPVRFRFIEALGPEAGDRAFRSFTQNIAASSPRSNIIDNMRNASYYYVQEASGAPIPKPVPRPYGHLAQDNHRANVMTIRSPEGWDLLRNPKPPSFAENLYGNQMPGTMDAHAIAVPAILSGDRRFLNTTQNLGTSKAPEMINPRQSFDRGVAPMERLQRHSTLWTNQPTDSEYAALENWFTRLGRREGMTPAQTQASGWVGGGKVSGLMSPPMPAAEILNRVIARTARETGKDPNQVLLDMIMRQHALRLQGPDAAGLAARGLLGDDQ